MNFSNIKLIVSDMDGTLLNSEGKLDRDFFPILKQLQSIGITFAIASGRQYQNLKFNLEDHHENVYFLADNGSYIVKNDQQIHVESLTREKAFELIQLARETKDCELVISGRMNAYVECKEEKYVEYVKRFFEDLQVLDSLEQIPEEEDILKVTIYDPLNSEKNSYPIFKSYEDHLKVKVSSEYWLDISEADAHKGHAVEILQKMLGVSKEETMAFGDYLNDIEMLQSVEYGFAMANAHPELHKITPHRALSNDESGVIRMLEKVLEDHQVQNNS
ncbi:HAD family hydrolase [Aureibacter tunicatorum]|uniref:Cof-type HAD-IIB family hydrolase n=1 Tax=Aureibacter tunicatorum TaxID=866807 RepID=A0AAE3XQV7_9BACT|nr:HAD family hydrolase [Aureibacter tunicatorum]MDR6240256.1 hypothetical protein [Aureibacter tunicatorum]BDD05863.1 haloacid dehalogenase [Aureibacter tunicatorum]